MQTDAISGLATENEQSCISYCCLYVFVEKINFSAAYNFYTRYLSDISIDVTLLSRKRLLYSY